MNPSLKILGIVINQVEGRKTILQQDIQEELRSTYQALIFNSVIKKRIKIEESSIFQKSIISYYAKLKEGEEFIRLAKEILQRIDKAEANREF